MGLLNVIRRLALREKLPIREIARRTGLSRNTIKKYLKAGTIEPKFSVPDRASRRPLGARTSDWRDAKWGARARRAASETPATSLLASP